ncbi:ABC transporter [Paenibacillus swuensis]|uniref:ABC transporter n=1 Tax=Paenibacillus swuensis TaxID=1178515 RepID=A0A172TFC5_9BACL|nr:ABC transporter ATP-binding protein [Paenibacillus swuensis]ANE45765.1 ABC transporter [Paenibacillus swuensis]
MHFLKKYIPKYWKNFTVAVLFLTAESLCELALPTLMALIIDVGVANRDLSYVLRMGGFMLLITAVGAIAASVRNILASRVSQAFGTELRSDLFARIGQMSFTSLDRFERASLITRMTNDVTQVQNFINGLMRVFVKAPLICIGSIILAARLDPGLARILYIIVPVVALFLALNMKIGFTRFTLVQKALDRMNSVMREYLSGVRVVKAFNRFDYEQEKFNNANLEYQAGSIHAMRATSVFNPASALTVNLGIIAVLWLGGLGVQAGDQQVGVVMAFINYTTQILFTLMLISMVVNLFIRARASAVRISEVFAQADPMESSEPERELKREPEQVSEQGKAGSLEAGYERGRIDFEEVSFSYPGASGEPVLRQISFTCLPGQTVGMIGSTGSGKSTLVSLIPRFYDVTSGRVKIGGVDVNAQDPQALRERIAIVPQKTMLFTGTFMENIRWGNEKADEAEAAHYARMAEADGFITSFPEGYDTVVGQRGVNLSGGQKQRVSIARALIRKPDILILDDCTSAVDVATEGRIKTALKAYAGGVTCLLIAQRISSVADADHIIVMDEGAIAGQGTHEHLLRTCRVYQEIYRSQLGKEA